MQLPGTGHPNEYDMILAHAGGVRSLDVAPNHSLLVSCSEKDACVFLWTFQSTLMEKRAANRTLESNIPVKEMESLFYYVQLQDPSQLTIESAIPLPLITDFARGLGMFISERQIQELYDEQCSKKKLTHPDEIKVDFSEAIRIYYNHFAQSTRSRSRQQLLAAVFDDYQSLNNKLDLHALIQTLVSQIDRIRGYVLFVLIPDDARRKYDFGFAVIGARKAGARFISDLDEIHQAFQTLGILNQRTETIDALSESLDRQTFVRLFSSEPNR
jgi:hypothetical protein